MNFTTSLMKWLLPPFFYSGSMKTELTYDVNKYHLLETDIRNLKNLTNEEKDFIITLPSEKLIDIIGIYYIQTEYINYLLENDILKIRDKTS